MTNAAVKEKDEPSMEEILASIRKIISEQDPEPAPAAEKPKPELVKEPEPKQEEVLELTRVVEEDGSITNIGDAVPEPEEAIAPEIENLEEVASMMTEETDLEEAAAIIEEDSMETLEDSFVEETATIEENAPEELEDVSEMFTETAEAEEEGLLSEASRSATLSSLAALGQVLHNDSRLGQKDLTLEALTRQLLQPLLKEWLDANLPTIVEEIVRDEVQQLTKKVKK